MVPHKNNMTKFLTNAHYLICAERSIAWIRNKDEKAQLTSTEQTAKPLSLLSMVN